MAAKLAAALLETLLAGSLGSSSNAPGNHFSIEGLTLAPAEDGTLVVGAQRLVAASLRLASGPWTLELADCRLRDLRARLGRVDGGLQLLALEAAGAELSGASLQGPLALPPAAVPSAEGAAALPARWDLGPLAAADGMLHAEIVDAHLVFDAHVTVKIRRGEVDFNQATVAHVGPDSRMGVSRLGVYVDAPNGRSYLYQFSNAVEAGVQYERRGGLIGPWVTDRGRLQLQPFAEAVLAQRGTAPSLGLTEQARVLFDRTAASGEVQLGDGAFAVPGLQAELAGRAEGRNAVRLQSGAVGRGMALELPSLAVRHVVLGAGAGAVHADAVGGALKLQLTRDEAQLHFALDSQSLQCTGLRLELPAAA